MTSSKSVVATHRGRTSRAAPGAPFVAAVNVVVSQLSPGCGLLVGSGEVHHGRLRSWLRNRGTSPGLPHFLSDGVPEKRWRRSGYRPWLKLS